MLDRFWSNEMSRAGSLTMSPAFSTLRANSAFSERKPYPAKQISTGVAYLRRDCCHTRVNHLGTVLNGNLDDLVAGQVSADRSILPSFANDVCFVGLCTFFMSVVAHQDEERGKATVLCRCIESRSS